MIELQIDSATQLVRVNEPDPSISVQWDQAAQKAVINSSPGPTIASRAYAIVHTAMFDAWAAYDTVAISTQTGDDLQRPANENTDANKIEAMSFAAFRVLSELFPTQVSIFNKLMESLGYDSNNFTEDTSVPAGVGNVAAEALMKFRRSDGSNQVGDNPDGSGTPYSSQDYLPINISDDIIDIESWSAEHVPINDPNGRVQEFLTPHWGDVTPFSLETSDEFRPPEPEPFLLENANVDFDNRTIIFPDGEAVDISKDLIGSVINPDFIEQTQEVINFSANLSDEQKLIAEFWEDGGGTSFPPGTWMSFGEAISTRDNNTVDEDAQLFFALGNAVFDAGVATWESKRFYDYVRPVRAVRSLGELGLIGEFDETLGGFAIDATIPNEGINRILAADFLTYQTPGGDPSPPFAEYVSGHSAFSAAGATVLELFTNSENFDAAVTFQPGDSRFEAGLTPAEELTLSWDTFDEAADEAGISRRYGAIHFEDGDLNGRILGELVGKSVWEKTQFFITGGKAKTFPNLLFGTRENDLGIDSALEITASSIAFSGDGNDLIDSSSIEDFSYLHGGDGNNDMLLGTNNRAFGGNGDDVFDSTLGNGGNRIYAGDGNDTIFMGGNDRAYGQQGNDRFFLIGDGNNSVSGGTGSDQFWIVNSNIAMSSNIITDFIVGEDTIGIGGIEEVNTFDDLIISGTSDAIVSVSETEIAMLLGVSSNDLSSSDFVFAESVV